MSPSNSKFQTPQTPYTYMLKSISAPVQRMKRNKLLRFAPYQSPIKYSIPELNASDHMSMQAGGVLGKHERGDHSIIFVLVESNPCMHIDKEITCPTTPKRIKICNSGLTLSNPFEHSCTKLFQLAVGFYVVDMTVSI